MAFEQSIRTLIAECENKIRFYENELENARHSLMQALNIAKMNHVDVAEQTADEKQTELDVCDAFEKEKDIYDIIADRKREIATAVEQQNITSDNSAAAEQPNANDLPSTEQQNITSDNSAAAEQPNANDLPSTEQRNNSGPPSTEQSNNSGPPSTEQSNIIGDTSTAAAKQLDTSQPDEELEIEEIITDVSPISNPMFEFIKVKNNIEPLPKKAPKEIEFDLIEENELQIEEETEILSKIADKAMREIVDKVSKRSNNIIPPKPKPKEIDSVTSLHRLSQTEQEILFRKIYTKAKMIITETYPDLSGNELAEKINEQADKYLKIAMRTNGKPTFC